MEIQSLGWFSDHGQGNCPKGNTGNWRPGKTRSPVVRIRRNPRKSGLQGRHPELSEPRSWLPCPEWWSLSPMAAPLGSQGSFSSDDNTSHACFPWSEIIRKRLRFAVNINDFNSSQVKRRQGVGGEGRGRLIPSYRDPVRCYFQNWWRKKYLRGSVASPRKRSK